MTICAKKTNCSIDRWLDLFKSCTLKTILIPLDNAFVEYLKADGIELPDDDASPDEFLKDSSLSFPSLQESIKSAITTLGGFVFPKLNWSSPKDAAWIAFGSTLKCTDVSSILLLLKSSDFVNHDLSQNEPVVLALRKWYELIPSMEFRCFVRNGKLIAISQRDHVNFYEFLVHEKQDLEIIILEFFTSRIQSKFFDEDCM